MNKYLFALVITHLAIGYGYGYVAASPSKKANTEQGATYPAKKHSKSGSDEDVEERGVIYGEQ